MQETALDKIPLGPEDKLIRKIYKFLLAYKLEEEQVKEMMVIWARGYSIKLDQWQTVWERNKKITLATAYKENLLKTFYLWHLPPARLAKIAKTNPQIIGNVQWNGVCTTMPGGAAKSARVLA
uniref:Uncharacterized protein n=1 Tax=Micrurus corallinus TaxID=54390 RepID=A0A2D4GKV8_MICCO